MAASGAFIGCVDLAREDISLRQDAASTPSDGAAPEERDGAARMGPDSAAPVGPDATMSIPDAAPRDAAMSTRDAFVPCPADPACSPECVEGDCVWACGDEISCADACDALRRLCPPDVLPRGSLDECESSCEDDPNHGRALACIQRYIIGPGFCDGNLLEQCFDGVAATPCQTDDHCIIIDRCRQGCRLYADCLLSDACPSIRDGCAVPQCRTTFYNGCVGACPDVQPYCDYPNCRALVADLPDTPCGEE